MNYIGLDDSKCRCLRGFKPSFMPFHTIYGAAEKARPFNIRATAKFFSSPVEPSSSKSLTIRNFSAACECGPSTKNQLRPAFVWRTLYCMTCLLLPIGESGGIHMPELRQNFFTKEWVIIATERAKRPEDLATHRVADPVPEFVESCPFCPGNESKTPPEVLRCPSNSERWDVRVIPNKFAALSSEAQPTRSLQHLRRRIEGFGFHEVIIDSPDHSRYMGLLSDEHVASILRAYKERYNALSQDHRVNHITIFKNHGADAGASLQHPHSQLIATPVIPSQVRHRLFEALRHYDDAGECMFCHMVEREVEDQTRIVLKGEHFVAMEVFASATPFTTHIFPLRQMASSGATSA